LQWRRLTALLIASIADKTAFHFNLAQDGTNNSMGQDITPLQNGGEFLQNHCEITAKLLRNY